MVSWISVTEHNRKTAELEKQIQNLTKCCIQRGARMQILHNAVISAYNYETSGPLWETIVKAKDWFDDDGVTLDT